MNIDVTAVLAHQLYGYGVANLGGGAGAGLTNFVSPIGTPPESRANPYIIRTRFKHSLAMRLVEQNVKAFLIRQQLGHKSFQSTLQYVNPTDKQASEAAAKAFSQIGTSRPATLIDKRVIGQGHI